MTGLRLPAEWEPHDRCLIAWPGHETKPKRLVPGAKRDFALIARAISEFEPVVVLAHPGFGAQAAAACGPDVEVVELAFDDVWIRDSGPLFAVRGDGELVAVDFRFNLWGSKLVPRERYADTGALLADWLGIRRLEVPFALEGGSVSTDGAGTLIALEPSILNPNRNPGSSREELEAAFVEFLGIERTIWLEHGLAEDKTDGHADNIAVFAGPGRVLCPAVRDAADANAARLAANRTTLEAAGLEVVELAALPYSEDSGSRLAHSYLNSFVGNGCVVTPLAGVPNDEEALRVLREAFPGREVVGVPGETLARAGGGVHCITQHLPLPAL